MITDKKKLLCKITKVRAVLSPLFSHVKVGEVIVTFLRAN